MSIDAKIVSPAFKAEAGYLRQVQRTMEGMAEFVGASRANSMANRDFLESVRERLEALKSLGPADWPREAATELLGSLETALSRQVRASDSLEKMTKQVEKSFAGIIDHIGFRIELFEGLARIIEEELDPRTLADLVEGAKRGASRFR